MSGNDEIKVYNNLVIYKNTVASVLFKGLGYLLSFISAPLMLECLGTNKYGVWASLLSIVSWIYYFDFGISGGLRLKLSGAIATSKFDDAKKYISVAYALILITVLACFCIACAFIYFFDIEQFFDLVNVGEDVNYILVIAILFACINLVISTVNAILCALQQVGMVSFFNFLGQGLNVVCLYVFVKSGISSLLYLAILQGVVQLVRNVAATIYVFKSVTQIRTNIFDVNFNYAHGILGFGLRLFVMQMAALVLNSTDNLIILKYFGADSVTPYHFCYAFFAIINTIFMTVMDSGWNAYAAAYACKDIKWIKSMLKKSLMIYSVFGVGTIAAIFIFEPFAKFWLRKELLYCPGLILLTALYFIMLMFSHNFSSFVHGTGKIKETTIGVFIEAIINVPISIYLAVYCGMGINGVILGSIVSLLIALVVYMYVAIREYKNLRGAIA